MVTRTGAGGILETMTRRDLLRSAAIAGLMGLLPACRRARQTSASEAPMSFEPLTLTADQWREVLTPEQFAVLREHGTERAFTSPLEHEKRAGTYVCAGCYLPLFSARGKFDSGTGWPSFFEPIAAANVATSRDFKLIYPRTEYHCARCGGHQGHVFNDGPAPTGQRWCNNGVALQFVPAGDPLPPLREHG